MALISNKINGLLLGRYLMRRYCYVNIDIATTYLLGKVTDNYLSTCVHTETGICLRNA